MDSLIISKFAAKNGAPNTHIIDGNGSGIEWGGPIGPGHGWDDPIGPGHGWNNPIAPTPSPSFPGHGWNDPIAPSPYVPNHDDGIGIGVYPMKASIGVNGGFHSSDGCTDFNGHITHDNGHGTTVTLDGSTSKCDGGHSNTSIGGGLNYKGDNGGIGIEVHGGDHKGAGINFDYKW